MRSRTQLAGFVPPARSIFHQHYLAAFKYPPFSRAGANFYFTVQQHSKLAGRGLVIVVGVVSFGSAEDEFFYGIRARKKTNFTFFM